MGLFTGTSAGKATLATRPGVEARATKVMLQAIKESQLEMGIQESDFGKAAAVDGVGEYGQKDFGGPGEGRFTLILPLWDNFASYSVSRTSARYHCHI